MFNVYKELHIEYRSAVGQWFPSDLLWLKPFAPLGCIGRWQMSSISLGFWRSSRGLPSWAHSLTSLPRHFFSSCFWGDLFSFSLEGSISGLVGWCLLQVFWGCGQSNSTFSFEFVSQLDPGLFFSTGPHCLLCLSTICVVFSWDRCWWMFAACVLCVLLSSKSLIHTASPVSHWN